jgi:hypothetical protein
MGIFLTKNITMAKIALKKKGNLQAKRYILSVENTVVNKYIPLAIQYAKVDAVN